MTAPQATTTPEVLRDRLLAALAADPHLTSRDVADTVHRVYGAALAEQTERADAVTHLLEHWADEHMTLKGLDGSEVHADWCYRCRLERAETAERERDDARAALVKTNARMVELADWAYRDLTGQTQHHVLSVITNLRDFADPDRTLHQPEEDHE